MSLVAPTDALECDPAALRRPRRIIIGVGLLCAGICASLRDPADMRAVRGHDDDRTHVIRPDRGSERASEDDPSAARGPRRERVAQAGRGARTIQAVPVRAVRSDLEDASVLGIGMTGRRTRSTAPWATSSAPSSTCAVQDG